MENSEGAPGQLVSIGTFAGDLSPLLRLVPKRSQPEEGIMHVLRVSGIRPTQHYPQEATPLRAILLPKLLVTRAFPCSSTSISDSDSELGNYSKKFPSSESEPGMEVEEQGNALVTSDLGKRMAATHDPLIAIEYPRNRDRLVVKWCKQDPDTLDAVEQELIKIWDQQDMDTLYDVNCLLYIGAETVISLMKGKENGAPKMDQTSSDQGELKSDPEERLLGEVEESELAPKDGDDQECEPASQRKERKMKSLRQQLAAELDRMKKPGPKRPH